MIKCPNCNMAVSEFATTCPHCGKTIDKESVTKAVETQNTSKKEINRKRQLRELGKEKYLPLILTIVCIIVECIMYTVYAMREVPTLSLNVGHVLRMVLAVIISMSIPLIISILFITKIYKSRKGYILKNIQMVIDGYFILGSLVGILSGIGNGDMKILYRVQALLVASIFVTSLILCIKMGKKQDVHSDEENEKTE
jgi:preprotein translocase subunit SecG